MGIVRNILLGVDTALGIANVVKGFQNQAALQGNRELEGSVAKLGIAQKIADMTGQPVPSEGISAGLSKQGINWPKSTEESQARMVESEFQKNPPATVDIQEGGAAVGKATPLPAAVARNQQATGIAQRVAPVGAAMPVMPKEKKIGILGASGIKTVTLPAGTDKVMTEPRSQTAHIMFDREGKPIANLGATQPHFLPKPEKTIAQMADETTAKTQAKWNATPDIYETDDRGIPTATYKRRPVKSATTKVKQYITEAERDKIMQESGGRVPTGTVVVKDREAENLKTARGRAVSLARGQFDLTDPKDKTKMDEFVSTQTEIEYNALKKGKEGQGAPDSGAPPVHLLKEGVQTSFKNGQVWEMRNGQAKRIK